MRIKKLLLMAATAAILTTTGSGMAMADPWNHPRAEMRHDERMDRRMDRREMRHDMYWRQGYHGFVGRDVVFRSLRAHQFYRWDGDPYWFHDRYVVRSYDRFGHVVFVEVNPYTGAFIGVVRF